MHRRKFIGSAITGAAATGAPAGSQITAGSIPMREFGKTGVKLTVVAQGGARMDLFPDIASAQKYIRHIYDLGINFFDCARGYWGGQSEQVYGGALPEFRKQVFITSKSMGRSRAAAEKDLEASLRALKTNYLDLWQMHDVRYPKDIDQIFGPGGALEAFEAAKKAGKCRFIGFTGHFDPQTHLTMLEKYSQWDSVLMPLHAADTAYLSFENTVLPVAVKRGIGIQAIKIFGKGFLLRAMSPRDCLRYVLNLPIHGAICGSGSQGQMEDNIRVAQAFRPLPESEMSALRRRAIAGRGVLQGSEMEYWKKGFFKGD